MQSDITSASAPAAAPQRREAPEQPRVAQEPPAGRQRKWLIVTLVTIPSVVIVGLLILIVWMSTRTGGDIDAAATWANYKSLFGDSLFYSALGNTAEFALIALATAAFFALPIAWLLERTDFGHRRLVSTAIVIQVLVPGFLTAMGWIFMFHPRIGAINIWLQSLFGFKSGPINIISVPGMGFVQGLGLTSIVFIMITGVIRNMDSALEESARMSGASYRTVLRRVTAPLLYPGLLAAGLYTAAIAIGVFDVPAIMGWANRIYTLSTYLYAKTSPIEGLPDYGLAGAVSVVLIILAILASVWYTRSLRRAKNYEVVSGKSYQTRPLELGKWRWLAWLFVGGYFLISLILPVLLLTFVSTQPYVRPLTLTNLGHASLGAYRGLPWNLIWHSAGNTLRLTLIVPTVALALGLLYSWTVLRSKIRFKAVYDYIAFLPHAVPSVVFSLGAMVVALYWTSGWYNLYGTVTLTIIVLSLIHVSFSSRILNSTLIQIHPDLEAAASMSGAPPPKVLSHITLPLLRHALAFGWLWMAILTFRELTVPVFLAAPGNTTLSVVAWTLWSNGDSGQAAALTLMMLLITIPLAAGYLRLVRVDQR